MKKKRWVFLLLVVVVILPVVVFLTFFLPGGRNQQNGTFGPGFRMPMVMRPGMMRMSGPSINSELDFLIHMIPHHEEAVSAAEILKENTEREEMRQFAEDIIQTQSFEIELMETWLESWYPDERDHDYDYQPMMRDLEGLKGEELDEAFLVDMIPHHMEAIMMSQQLLVRGLAEHEEVAFLAREIRNTQRQEIHRMMAWLSQWNGYSPIASANDRTMLMWMSAALLALLVLLVVGFLVVLTSEPKSKTSLNQSAKHRLDVRYARGEISQEEYRKSRDELKG